MTTEQDPTTAPEAEVGELLVHAMGTAEEYQRRDVFERLVAVRDRLESMSDPPATVVAARVGPARRSSASGEAAVQIARAFATLESDLRARRAMLEDSSRAARVRAELTSARTHQERAASAGREWQAVVGDGFAGLNSDIEFTLRMRMRAVLAEREAAINTGDPGVPGAADLSLRECLVIEAGLAYRQLSEGAGAISATVARTVGTPSPQRPIELPVLAPSRLVAGLAPPRQARAGTPLATRLLRVVRPGWSGIMMATIAARLLNVHVSAPVLVALALAGALLLGGAALTGDRKRQLDKRRTDAIAALRGTVEEFRLTLAKQLRDASRALQRDLRREAGETAARASAAAAAELDVARRAAQLDRCSAEELTRIAGELSRLGELRRRALVVAARASAADAGVPDEPRAPTLDTAGSISRLHVVA